MGVRVWYRLCSVYQVAGPVRHGIKIKPTCDTWRHKVTSDINHDVGRVSSVKADSPRCATAYDHRIGFGPAIERVHGGHHRPGSTRRVDRQVAQIVAGRNDRDVERVRLRRAGNEATRTQLRVK